MYGRISKKAKIKRILVISPVIRNRQNNRKWLTRWLREFDQSSIVKTSELRQCLWRDLDTILSEFDFKRVSDGRTGEYRREVAGGSQRIGFPTYSRSGRVELYCPDV